MSRDDVPTKDGKYIGRKYECRVCGLMVRRKDAVWQRGGWVHRDSCKDDPPGSNNMMGQTDSR